MAANLLSKAAQTIRRKNETEKRRKVERKHGELMLIGHGSAVAGGGVAALVDEKWGGNSDTAEFKGIPTNALLGGAAVIGGVMTGGRSGAAMIGAGTGTLATVVYNLVREKVDFDESE
jgi:hypothetical protein